MGDIIMSDLATAGVDNAQDLQQKFKTLAERRYEAYVTLISMENQSETQLSETLKLTAAVKLDGRLLIIVDQKLAGETRTAPHIRTPPMQDETMQLLVAAATRTRNQCGYLKDGDFMLVPDAGKHGAPG